MAACATCGTNLGPGVVYCPRCGTRVEGAVERDDYVYEAFLSYRHLPRDRGVTVGLQRRLEGMRIPAGVRPSPERRRLGRFFRDEDELPTSGSLSNQIQEALCQSRYLVVVVSPRTEESLWVRREIEFFAEQHGRDHILVALAEGTIGESLPALLATRLVRAKDGSVIEVADEPLAADLTQDDGRRLRSESLRIAAALMGCGYDGLNQRMRLRRMRIAAAIAAGVAVGSIGFGSYALRQERLLAASFEQTQRNESELLARESATLLAEGDRMGAIRTALEALPSSSTDPDRPYVPVAQLALERALDVYPSPDYWHTRYALDEVGDNGDISEGGLVALIGADSMVHVSSLADGGPVCTFDAREGLDVGSGYHSTPDLVFCGETLVVAMPGDDVGAFDPMTGELRWRLEGASASYDAAPVPYADGTCVAVLSTASPSALGLEEQEADLGINSRTLLMLDASTGEVLDHVAFAHSAYAMSEAIAVSEDGRHVAAAYGPDVTLVDLETREAAEATLSREGVRSLSFVGDALVSVSVDGMVSRYSTNPHTLQCFELDGSQRWSIDLEIDSRFDRHGNEYPTEVGFASTWQGDGFEGTQMVFAASRSVIFVDEQSGEVTYRTTTPNPVLAVFVSRDGGPVAVCCAEGEVLYRNPKPDDPEAGYLGDMTVGGGNLLRARFVRHGDDVILCAWPFSGYRMVTYEFMRTDSNELAEPVRGPANQLDWSNHGFAVTDDEAVELYDPQTFELRWSTPLASLEALDTSLSIYFGVTVLADHVYVCGVPADPDLAKTHIQIYALDSQTGEVTSSVTLATDAEWSLPDVRPLDTDEGMILANDGSDLCLYDMVEDRIVFQTHRDGFTRGVWCGRGGAVLEEQIGDVTSMALVSFETGDDVDCDLAAYRPTSLTSDTNAIAANSDCSQLAMACDDGVTRLFSTADGSLLWESADAPADVQKLGIADGDDEPTLVLVQDTSGHCVLLDGADGSLLASSRTVAPAIGSLMRTSDPQVVMGFYSIPGLAAETGIVLIDIDPEAFGPRSEIYEGLMISGDGRAVMLRDNLHEGLVRIPYYSLDELIALAEEQLALADGTEVPAEGEPSPLPAG